jgi:dsDNA-specific endonuclease/ATPase MutS2
LKQSEENRQKAEKDAATVQGLRERLHKAETALSDNITQQAAREADILSRLESQCRRFVSKFLEFLICLGLSCGSPVVFIFIHLSVCL